MNRPASLWFWRDWESDVALKACSLAAQGLWKRMLCIAAQHDPIGYVAVNRVGLDPEGIARIVGVGVDECRSLMDELSLNGVFSRDRYGTIYNRRMIRDEKKAAMARKNGKLGGNPMLLGHGEIAEKLDGNALRQARYRERKKALGNVTRNACRTQTPHPNSPELLKSGTNVTIDKTSGNLASDNDQAKGRHKARDKLKPLPKRNKNSFYQKAAREGPPPSPARGSRLAATPKRGRRKKRLADEKELERLREKYLDAPPAVSARLLESLAKKSK